MFRIPHMFRDRGMFAPGGGAPFGLSALQADSNCILIQDPSQVWGVQDFLPRRNLLLATDTLATQTVAVVATAYKLYMQGTGSITLSGTATGTLNGTGANDRVSLSFTPTAGTLTLTVSGTVTFGMLCRADTIDQSYQKITDWTTEQYTWAAQRQVPWLRRNYVLDTEDLGTSNWSRTGVTVTTVGITPPSGCVLANKVTHAGASGEVWTSAGTRWSFPSGTRIYARFLLKYFDTRWVRVLVGILPSVNMAAWVDVQNGVLGAGLSYTGAASAGTQQLTPLGSGWYQVDVSVLFSVASSAAGFIQSNTAADDASGTRVAGSFLCTGLHSSPAPIGSYQPILASWDATYTAAAIAAGYPISLWQDAAGTIAVNGDNQEIGKMLNYKLNGLYDATQATAANQPKWRLDSNGKALIERDLVNDSLPVTLPNLGSNCAIYVGEGATVAESTGQTLNGSYAPITPAKDYGRVIFQAPTSNAAKVIKWLKAKAGY